MITNKHGLPAPLVNAIKNDPYSRGKSDISVTQLIQPPQLRRLVRGVQTDEDASEFIWRLLGQAVHTILERAYPDTAIVEKRLFAEVLGWTVSGQFDVYESGVLTDYKITSVYARGGKVEWENQLNLLRALAERNGMPVSRVQIVAIFRDWRPKEALSEDYPQSQVAVLPVALWPLERAEEYLIERVRLHRMETPPECTDEERWMSPEKWALMQKGRKRAVKLFDVKPEQITLTDGQYWELRPGIYRRCESYCRASTICPQWKAYESARADENAASERQDVADAPGHLETGAVVG
jgi:hypothetical protein